MGCNGQNNNEYDASYSYHGKHLVASTSGHGWEFSSVMTLDECKAACIALDGCILIATYGTTSGACFPSRHIDTSCPTTVQTNFNAYSYCRINQLTNAPAGTTSLAMRAHGHLMWAILPVH